MNKTLSRRRVIRIAGLLTGAAVLFPAWKALRPQRLVRWEGQVLGALASLELYHEDEDAARALITDCLAEISRLSEIFSLYRPESAISRLNRDRHLASPPRELVTVLSESLRYSDLSGGAFDVTVQPLWDLYAEHFAHPQADPDGPSEAAVAAARDRVDYRKVSCSTKLVSLGRAGMAVTFNGIAQGYITDCVTDLLKRRGVQRVLAQLDAYRAIGSHPDGGPWHVGIADPRSPEQALGVIELTDRAMATSGGYGTSFDSAGRFHHLFDPATGRPAFSWAGTNVVAASAMKADGLSTAIAVAPRERAAEILRKGGGETAYLVDFDNVVTTIQG
ncbi:MAG TPA: FAD:protein FMN transferase [Rhodospirillaceae bacterium]|nr:FAD:protein FMN transferase [Rhodospirillaceae bacterium]